MQEALATIRTHDTHKLLSAKAAFLRLSPDEKARFAHFFEAEAPSAEEVRRQRRARELEFARRVHLTSSRVAAEDHDPAGPCGDSNFSGPFRLRLARAPSSSSIANPLRLARRE